MCRVATQCPKTLQPMAGIEMQWRLSPGMLAVIVWSPAESKSSV
jgi:hypothetical protein